jgi:hypothetical protein
VGAKVERAVWARALPRLPHLPLGADFNSVRTDFFILYLIKTHVFQLDKSIRFFFFRCPFNFLYCMHGCVRVFLAQSEHYERIASELVRCLAFASDTNDGGDGGSSSCERRLRLAEPHDPAADASAGNRSTLVLRLPDKRHDDDDDDEEKDG